jgi:hypothetical protein
MICFLECRSTIVNCRSASDHASQQKSFAGLQKGNANRQERFADLFSRMQIVKGDLLVCFLKCSRAIEESDENAGFFVRVCAVAGLI